MPERYVDANVFVYALGTGPMARPGRSALRTALRGGACTASLTFDEVAWAQRKHGMAQAAARTRPLLRLAGLRILATDATTIAAALDLMESHGLDPRDAIHAAHALAASGGRILSADPDFDQVPGIRRQGLE